MDSWLTLHCAYCQARFQIPLAHAHLRGRCPACGFRIAAPRPKPYQPPTFQADSDEPLGLVPEDEEWPEPAKLLERQDETTAYALNAGPLPLAPAGPVHAPGDVYKLSTDQAAAPPPAAKPDAGPVVTPYGFRPEGGLAPVPPAPPRDLDLLPTVELAPARREPPKAPAAKAPPAPARPPEERLPLPPPPAQPANLIDALFAEPAAAPAPPPPKAPPTSKAPPAPIPVAQIAPAPAAPVPVAKLVEPPVAQLAPPKAAPPPEPPDDEDEETVPTAALADGTAEDEEEAEDDGERYAPYKLNPNEVNPRRADPPPAHLTEGLIRFPFQPGNLVPMLTLAFAATAQAFMTSMLVWLSGNELAAWAVLGYGLATLGLMLVFGSYGCACLMTAVQDTAAGNQEVSWPVGGWREWLAALARLTWVAFIALLFAQGMSFLLCNVAPLVWWAVIIPPAFSFVLLSIMAGDSFFHILDTRLGNRLAAKPGLLVTLVLGSYALWLTAGAVAAVGVKYWLAPVVGLAVAACWLAYGRLLGRIGWALTQERKKRKKKRKRRAVRPQTPAEPPA